MPLSGTKLKGVDALYAVVQTPSGIPVACVAINGAKNAAYLAAAILGLKNERIRRAYEKHRQEQAGA